ncbi:hypothetical protein IFM89_014107 [Coptis chinensis]|uniref:Uncharacterized protein n=1 Tax=Coptis chinensis TaxID=261450 RepID=A0A835HST7_9MAGN|nr:hypothetical protein IFM89_014107 [Coptis chinensis]
MPETSMPDLAEEVVVEDNKDETDAAIVYDSWDMLNSMWKALVSDKYLDGEVMWSCIKFCYLFPKTHEFNKDDIIQLWIAEGFIPVTHIRLETTAGLYFEALQELSIFQFSFLASTGEPRYKLNPSIVDLFEERHSALDEYYRVDDGGNSCISENTLHSSFRDPVTLKDLFEAKNLCSLMILHQHGSHIEQVPRDLFLNLRSLRVLDFSDTKITELPSTIRYLKDLRLLNLSGTPIQALPNLLGSLSQMQTLKLRDCFKLVSLPKCIRKLINLRHLEANVASLLVSMPPGLGDLNELQTLPAFVVGKENGCHITELKHMVNVHGTLHILRLENVFSLEEAKEAALDQLKYIQKLELQWTELHNGHEILENLRPHMKLEELQIVGYGGAKFPTWIGDPIFSKLTTITIHDCRKCELLPPLGKLPLLKALSISKMHEVKVINHQFCGRDMDNESLDLERLDRGTVYENLSSDKAFTRLVNLTLNEIPKLEKWTGVVVGDFPQLQKLNIFGCSNLITLHQLSLLSSLKKLEIRLCPSLESFPKKGLPNSLQHLVIIDCPLLKEFCQKEQEEQWRKLVHIPDVWVDYLQISALRHSEFLQKVSAQRLGNELAKPSETESAQLSEIESAQALEIEPAQPSETESTKLSEVVLLQRLETETTQPSKTKPNQQSEIESAKSSHNMSQLAAKERVRLYNSLLPFL